MWLFMLSALFYPVFSNHEPCPQTERPPGVLVVPPGSELVLGCGGWAKVDGVEVTVLRAQRTVSVHSTTDRTTRRHASSVIQTASDSAARAESVAPTVTEGTVVTEKHPPSPGPSSLSGLSGPSATAIRDVSVQVRMRRLDPEQHADADEQSTMSELKTGQTTEEGYRINSHAVGHLGYTLTSDNIPISGAAPRPTRAGGAGGVNSEGGGVEGGEDDYEEGGEEGGRVTRGLAGKPQWKVNGKLLRGREERGERGGKRGTALSLTSVSLRDAGNYSCHRRDQAVTSFRVIVAVPPETPTLSCYKRSPSSKIRCDWTARQPVMAQPQCHLFVSKSLSGSFSRVSCSSSAVLRRCWCALAPEEDDLRVLHRAFLCVSNAAGSSPSPQIHFIPLDILKPDPPSELRVLPVDGHRTRLRVTWTYPPSWKERDRYYMLQYRLTYRPGAQAKATDVFTGSHSYLIADVMPGVEYVIQLGAKEEFDGIWSDWSSPVHGVTWTAPVPTAVSGVSTTTCDYFVLCGEGSGVSDEELPREPEPVGVAPHVLGEWPHLLWGVGCGVLLSVTLLMAYLLRHKERFVSKFVSLSNNKPRLPDSAPSTSAPAAQEVHALLNSDPPPHKQPLPQEVEVEEEEEEEVVESKAFDFNNTSYFLVQTDQS